MVSVTIDLADNEAALVSKHLNAPLTSPGIKEYLLEKIEDELDTIAADEAYRTRSGVTVPLDEVIKNTP